MTTEVHHATYAELEQLPENVVGELIDGQLYAWPRPSGRHTRVASFLGMTVGPLYDIGRGGPGGWWILDEPEVHLIRDTLVVVPDVAGWRRERMPVIPNDHRFLVPPDWVCEVLSPSTRRHDRGKKMRIYADYNVSWMWLIDPDDRTLEVMQLGNGRWSIVNVFTASDKVSAEPFPEAEIDLTTLWAETSPLPPP